MKKREKLKQFTISENIEVNLNSSKELAPLFETEPVNIENLFPGPTNVENGGKTYRQGAVKWVTTGGGCDQSYSFNVYSDKGNYLYSLGGTID